MKGAYEQFRIIFSYPINETKKTWSKHETNETPNKNDTNQSGKGVPLIFLVTDKRQRLGVFGIILEHLKTSKFSKDTYLLSIKRKMYFPLNVEFARSFICFVSKKLKQ